MLHPITWLVWLTAALVAALSTRNPLYLAVVVLAAATVRIAWRGQSPAALGWGVIIRLGLMLWGLTALFDALTAHHGATVLFALPGNWPLVGGPITLESLLYGIISGLALTTLLITFATFNSTVNHHRLLRYIPNFLRQAGLIVSIALVFVPQMMATLRDLRQAQRLRGHRFRGMRDLLPLLVPLLGNGLERAIGLAEAMEARGFASPPPVEQGWKNVARRLAMLLCVLIVIAGLFSARYWPAYATAGWTMVVVGSAVFFAILWRAGATRERTQYRSLNFAQRDLVIMAACGITLVVVGGLTLLRPASLTYSPYPEAALPAFDPLIGLALLLLALPALLVSEEAPAQQSAGTTSRTASPELSKPPALSRKERGPVIELQDVSYWYPQADAPALDDVTLSIEAGEFVLVMGPSGAGKSTLLRALNGLVPHFTGGVVSGRIQVAGRDPIVRGTDGMADAVGFVFQDPEAQFVAERVEDELVFALENMGHPREEMERRLIWILDLLDLQELRHRRVETLSGGERQRVAIGSVLALQPGVLVLDEPTSQLDPAGAADVLAAVTELNRELGLTVVLAEHRLERVLPYIDKIIYFPDTGRAPSVGRPRDILRRADLVPPVVELARAMDWHPLPLTVEEARQHLATTQATASLAEATRETAGTDTHLSKSGGNGKAARPQLASNSDAAGCALRVSDLWYGYEQSETPALRGVDLAVEHGEVVAVVGSNGAGKTTVLRCVMGLLQPDQGAIEVMGRDAGDLSTAELASFVGFVPQNAGASLFTDSVADEITFTRRSQGLPPNGHAVLETFGLTPLAQQYPWDLSVGERQRVAIAAFLAGEPELLLLDEPTRGLDYGHKTTLASIVHRHRAGGHAVLLVTHDVELVAAVADRMVVLEDGEVVAEGPTDAVMREHPAFASQMSRLFEDGRLTPADVAHDSPLASESAALERLPQ